MTSVRGHGRPHREHLSVALDVAPSITPPPPLKSGDELSDQPAKLSGTKLLANASAAATNIPKYSKDNLQQILQAVLEAQAPAPAPAPAFVVFEVPREKLKVCSLDLYRGKSHMDCYNFC